MHSLMMHMSFQTITHAIANYCLQYMDNSPNLCESCKAGTAARHMLDYHVCICLSVSAIKPLLVHTQCLSLSLAVLFLQGWGLHAYCC